MKQISIEFKQNISLETDHYKTDKFESETGLGYVHIAIGAHAPAYILFDILNKKLQLKYLKKHAHSIVRYRYNTTSNIIHAKWITTNPK